MLLEGEEVHLEVLVVAQRQIRDVEGAQVEADVGAQHGRPEMRHLERIATDLQGTKRPVHWSKQDRVQALNPVVRHVQIGDVDVDEHGRVHCHDFIVCQRQCRQVLTLIIAIIIIVIVVVITFAAYICLFIHWFDCISKFQVNLQ